MALKAEVKAMVGDVIQAAKEEGSGEWSKQAQAMVNRLTNNNKGEQEVADFGTMCYPEGVRKVASDAKAVGALASEFFHTVSKHDPDCQEFDIEFERKVAEAFREMEGEHRDFQSNNADSDAPSLEEVRAAIKLHKSPGMDGVCNWMLVWGGETVVKRPARLV